MYNQYSFNVGGARIDTRLNNTMFVQGDAVSGQVLIAGGGYAQEIGELFLKVCVMYSGKKHHQQTAEIATFKLSERFAVQPNQQGSLPFQFQLPFNTPATSYGGGIRVWLRTVMDTAAYQDPSDDDFIEVRLNPFKERVLGALQRMGLQLKKVDCEVQHGAFFQPPMQQQGYNQGFPPQGGFHQQQGFGMTPPPNQFGQPAFPNQAMPNQQTSRQISSNNSLVQEFEFRSVNHQYRGLDELEIIFNQWNPLELEMLIQIDRKHKGFFSGEEKYVRHHVNGYNFDENSFMYTLDGMIRSWI